MEEVRRVERQERLVKIYRIERRCWSNERTRLKGWCCKGRWRWLRGKMSRLGFKGKGRGCRAWQGWKGTKGLGGWSVVKTHPVFRLLVITN